MKKCLALFLSSLFVNALGMGLIYSSLKGVSPQEVNAKEGASYVEFDDKGITKLGSYPQNIVTNISANEIKNNGVVKETPKGDKYYIYNSKKYVILDTAIVDKEGSINYNLSNGDKVDNYDGMNDVVIEFNDIEWQLLKKGDNDTAYLISTRILDRKEYNFSLPTHIQYNESTLFEYLNQSFKHMAFNYDDLSYFAGKANYLEDIDILLPSKDDIDIHSYKDDNLKQASDFAILSRLTSHSAYNQGFGIPYLNAGYWLSTLSSDSDRIEVCWAKVTYTSCLMDDNKIGVRPVIYVNYKEGSSGGGSGEVTPSNPVNNGGGNPALALGITFTILGAGGLIALFIVWSKKFKDGKPAIWLIIALAGSLVVSIVGLGSLAGGMVGGSSCIYYGYYVQTGSHGSGQAGTTGWLIKSDGTCSYCGYLEDTVNASDFSEVLNGTYTFDGSKIKLTVDGAYGGTYTYTVKNCKYLYAMGSEAYHYVRGE